MGLIAWSSAGSCCITDLSLQVHGLAECKLCLNLTHYVLMILFSRLVFTLIQWLG
jgi:hypothetical protein